MCRVHWPEFHNLLSNDHFGDITPKLRQKHVIDNPHLIDLFFTERFVKFRLKKSLQASWYWYRYEYAVQRGSIHCYGVAKLQNDLGLCELTAVACTARLVLHRQLFRSRQFSAPYVKWILQVLFLLYLRAHITATPGTEYVVYIPEGTRYIPGWGGAARPLIPCPCLT